MSELKELLKLKLDEIISADLTGRMIKSTCWDMFLETTHILQDNVLNQEQKDTLFYLVRMLGNVIYTGDFYTDKEEIADAINRIN